MDWQSKNNFLLEVASNLGIKINEKILNILRELIDEEIAINDLIIIFEELRNEAES